MSFDPQMRSFAFFYFFFYAVLGAYSPYIGRYLESHGYSGYVVGGVLAVWYATRIVSPPFWASRMDQCDRPGRWFFAACVLSSISFAGLLFTSSLLWIYSAMIGFGFFYNAIMAQFDAMTLNALQGRGAQYGRVRVWGSIGFLVIAGSMGSLLDLTGAKALVWLTLPLLVLMIVSAWPHRQREPQAPQINLDSARTLFMRPGVRSFLWMALLMQAGFGPFYVFFSIHMHDYGHSDSVIGLLWAVGVIAEIIVFWFAPRIIEKIGAGGLIFWCIAVTAVRWVITGYLASSMTIMLFAQLSHALSFALFHACSMERMSRLFPGKDAMRGQGLLYGFSSGIGGVAGALIAALLWEQINGSAAFVGGAILSLIALVVYRFRVSGHMQTQQSERP